MNTPKLGQICLPVRQAGNLTDYYPINYKSIIFFQITRPNMPYR